jgi:hypothetical protein
MNYKISSLPLETIRPKDPSEERIIRQTKILTKINDRLAAGMIIFLLALTLILVMKFLPWEKIT